MKIGLFTEFSYPGKSEQQTYAEVLEQIGVADALGYDFFSITESYGKDLFSCSPFPLGLYVAAGTPADVVQKLNATINKIISTTGAADSLSHRHHQHAGASPRHAGERGGGCRLADRR